jgi:hypothetical protein
VATLKGINLTLLIGPAVPVPAPQSLVDALESAQVTVDATSNTTAFQLVFDTSKNSIITRTLLPAGYFDPLIRVIMICWINGIPDVLCDGVITQQHYAPSNQPGGSKLTITGEDLTRLMDLIDLTGDVPYPAMSAEARVQLILAKYMAFGIVTTAIPPLFPVVDTPTSKTPMQKGSDLAYVKHLAEQNGYIFFIEPTPTPGLNIAYWGPEVRAGVLQPALTVNSDTQTNVESLSFVMNGTQFTQYFLKVQLPETKLSIPVPIPDVGLLKPPLALRPPVALKYEKIKAAQLKTSEAIAKGLGAKGKSKDMVTADGSLNVLDYGRVLKARQLVGVRGASVGYNGLYYVDGTTTTMKRGEVKQTFKLKRDGLISNVPRVAV